MNESKRINRSNQQSKHIASNTNILKRKEIYNINAIQAKLYFGTLSNRDVMQLQATIGNKATMQFLKNYMNTNSDSKINSFDNQVMQKKENNTGLPDNLKAGVENLSGMSMDDVRVHFNSDKPKQVSALAYTQGSEIHIGSGQEKYLPHEIWHVVQQKQGKVKPIIQLKGMAVNDDAELELEADMMGKKLINSVFLESLNNVENNLDILETSNSQEQKVPNTIQLKYTLFFKLTAPGKIEEKLKSDNLKDLKAKYPNIFKMDTDVLAGKINTIMENYEDIINKDNFDFYFDRAIKEFIEGLKKREADKELEEDEIAIKNMISDWKHVTDYPQPLDIDSRLREAYFLLKPTLSGRHPKASDVIVSNLQQLADLHVKLRLGRGEHRREKAKSSREEAQAIAQNGFKPRIIKDGIWSELLDNNGKAKFTAQYLFDEMDKYNKSKGQEYSLISTGTYEDIEPKVYDYEIEYIIGVNLTRVPEKEFTSDSKLLPNGCYIATNTGHYKKADVIALYISNQNEFAFVNSIPADFIEEAWEKVTNSRVPMAGTFTKAERNSPGNHLISGRNKLYEKIS